MKFKNRFAVRAAATCLAALATVAAGAPSSSATTMSGVYVTVICPTADQEPVGMWYSGGGYQGWARPNGSYAGNGVRTFSMGLPTWSSVSLAVGCGGSPARWANTWNGSLYVSTTPVVRRTMDCYRLRSSSSCGVA